MFAGGSSKKLFGHRGCWADAIYKYLKPLVIAEECVVEASGRQRLLRLLAAGDPKGEVTLAWHAKEMVRSVCDHHDPSSRSPTSPSSAPTCNTRVAATEIRQLGRTVRKWRHQNAAWHHAHLTNAPTEAANNLVKLIKRGGFKFTHLPQLPRPALRRTTQLGTYSPPSDPLRSEAPTMRDA